MNTLRPSLSSSQLAELRKKNDFYAAASTLSVFIGLTLSVTLYITWPSFATLAVAFILVGALQHHLLIIQHETLHFTLFSPRWLNEGVGHLSSYMIGFTMRYRKQHMQHHQYLGFAQDPDLKNYISYPDRRFFVIDALTSVLGLAAARQFVQQNLLSSSADKQRRQDIPRKSASFDRGLIGVGITQLALLGTLSYFSSPLTYFLIWILPLLTVAKSLAHFRNVAEHLQVRDVGDPEMSRYRSIRSNWLEAFFFAPMNFNYHAEHHLYPQIPFYNLPLASKLLFQQDEYRQFVELDSSYLQVLFAKAARPPSRNTL